MPPKRLSTVIRELRRASALSQRELAHKADVTGAYIAQLETGVKKNPSLDILKRLACALACP
jgi:transcriptional regulator with XRE-family HTH domain